MAGQTIDNETGRGDVPPPRISKGFAVTLLTMCVVALVIVTVMNIHRGPSQEECLKMAPSHYWSHGKCWVNPGWQGYNGPTGP